MKNKTGVIAEQTFTDGKNLHTNIDLGFIVLESSHVSPVS